MSLTKTEPQTIRRKDYQAIGETTQVKVESEHNPNARSGRYQPGMIGWGVGQNYLVDRQPLEKTHIEKPQVRGFDQKAF